jgi:aspartate kinase
MIVMKFGGTSVGDADRISNTAEIVKSYIKKKPVVVVSAVTKITDKLIEAANASLQGKAEEVLESIKKIHFEVLQKLSLDISLVEKDLEDLKVILNKIKKNKIVDNKVMDSIQSFGERMSSKIVAAQLNSIGVKAQAFNSWDLGLITNAEFGNAEPLQESFSNLNKNIKKLNVVPVITGFIGKNEKGEITTLGRGGSDYSAGIIGSAIDADEVQIWTDVNGIMTTDPRTVSNAMTIKEVSFAEASELAYFGAKVLHPKTILPAMKKNIPVKVLNSFDSKEEGTIIVNRAHKSNQIVKAIAYKKGITLINIESTRMLGAYGFLARVFEVFYKYKQSVDVVSTSEVSVSMTIDNDKNLSEMLPELKCIADVEILKGKAIVCVVGEGMRNSPGIAGKTFMALGKNKVNIEMISQGASEINITFVVNEEDAQNAVRVLHKEYFGQ